MIFQLVIKNVTRFKKFNVYLKKNKILLKFDSEQIGRVIFNLVKNSIESIQEKSLKMKDPPIP